MAIIDSAYQYYLSTYGNCTVSRYDSHKKSELRAVYNNIVKTNKDSPLYKIKNTSEAQKFAIDIKERAHSIQNVAASLTGDGGDIEQAFNQRVAQSSDEDSVMAEYIGQDNYADKSLKFQIEVRQLASSQVNLGHFMKPDRSDIAPGTYGFDLTTAFNSYEFQYNVGGSDTNRNVQEKIMRLINSATVGLQADIVENKDGYTALRIESRQTGLDEDERCIFEIMPSPNTNSMRAIDKLGIDHMERNASNSSFLLNGNEHSSFSNTFTINNDFELTLKKPSPAGKAAQIGFKADGDAIADNIQLLVNVYNNFIQLGQNHTEFRQSNRLLNDISGVAKQYTDGLSSMGIDLQEDGSLAIDRGELTQSVSAPDARTHFITLNNFRDSLSDKATHASIDPMNYVNKIVVAYKNPAGNNFVTPYITSIYSGMMMDRYC